MGCNQSDSKQSESLYDRLGGKQSMNAVTKSFYSRVLEDPILIPFFENVDKISQMNKFEQFITFAFGGPTSYNKSDMKAVHAHLKINEEAFNHVAEHLVAVLDEYKVPEQEKSEVLAIVTPLKDQIVNC